MPSNTINSSFKSQAAAIEDNMVHAPKGSAAAGDLLGLWETACLARAQESTVGRKEVRALLKKHITDNASPFQSAAVEIDWKLNPIYGFCQKISRPHKRQKLHHGMQ